MAMTSLMLKVIINACALRWKNTNFGELSEETLDDIVDSYTKLDENERQVVKQGAIMTCISEYGMEPPENMTEDEDQDSIH